MILKKIKFNSIAFLVVIAIITGVSACLKDEAIEPQNDLNLQLDEGARSWIQQVREILAKDPSASIYTTVSNGVYTIVSNPPRMHTSPRLKSGIEVPDTWIKLEQTIDPTNNDAITALFTWLDEIVGVGQYNFYLYPEFYESGEPTGNYFIFYELK